MPKRKHNKDMDITEICKKLKELEKKVYKRSRRRSSSSVDTPIADTTPPPVSYNEEDEPTERQFENIDLTEPNTVTDLPQYSEALPTEMFQDIAPEVEPGLDSDLLEILGEDPTVTERYGKEIHRELATRFEHITTNGLDKSLRKELCLKYLTPINSKKIGSPVLNEEIKAALSENVLKRDKGIEARQKQIAATISCLAEALSLQLEEKNKNTDVIKSLTDASKLLCDIQHNESLTRRNFAVYSVKKEMKDTLINTKIDSMLFGEDLAESLKVAKAVSKSSSELKIQPKKVQSSVKNLNWKTPAGARAQPPAYHRRPAPLAQTNQLQSYSGNNHRYASRPPPAPLQNRAYQSNASRQPQHLHRPAARK